MHVESVGLTNFKCFGDGGETVDLDEKLTAFIGTNGSGKTAVCQALQRVFGISSEERTVRLDDFHVPASEVDPPEFRTLRIDVTLAFPELQVPSLDISAVPDFFRHLAAAEDGKLKCRIVLESQWTEDGTVDGTIETKLVTVSTFEKAYTAEQTTALPAAERSRIQFVYVPASRDGARQVTSFLRGRLWRAARWSEDMKALVRETSAKIDEKFHGESATKTVEAAFGRRWAELHGAGTHAFPKLRVFEPDVNEFLRDVDLAFEPDHTKTSRPAKLLSDGQKSLLHLALTTASLDIELSFGAGRHESKFEIAAAHLPSLTILGVEEPENNLSAFYLSRIIQQLLELGESPKAQVLLSSHSASSLGRVEPDMIRYFRHDVQNGRATVRSITLPEEASDAGIYVREAVRAYPELYFARFVILGEGDSEQVVVPAVAKALGIDLDPSFVAMVPLGGRHTNHFWRLLTDLEIPHATLLDLDYGRAGGGRGRLRDACKNLAAVGVDLTEVLGDIALEELDDDDGQKDLSPLFEGLRTKGIFFSSPLDLDMLMMTHYADAYQRIEGSQRGPQESDAFEAVLGTGGGERSKEYWTPPGEEGEKRAEALRWYRYLFSNRSKPTTHLQALSRLKQESLQEPPEVLEAIVRFAGDRLANR
ncbi:hypothetical protein BIU82_13975 [Arthrobacter sp. SW1]|uniref:ATP-dependent nuclease n=1 Tax=Arthrobacter sp. SW1 TaxID=1920889 RepID=UPI000877D089|nr:AAA family ATPase [Arthrobacter sp. SW1]OFI39435.1 hypothetical protein BIU82_13975 [Arthrobacter sp. SW1]